MLISGVEVESLRSSSCNFCLKQFYMLVELNDSCQPQWMRSLRSSSWLFLLSNRTGVVDIWTPSTGLCTVSDYGLGDRGSTPDGDRGFFLYPLRPAGSGAHPASCTMGTGGSFPGGKGRPRRDADHSPLLVSRLKRSRSCTSSHPKRLLGVYWDHFTCFTVIEIIAIKCKISIFLQFK
jgi:hypothetical protein